MAELDLFEGNPPKDPAAEYTYTADGWSYVRRKAQAIEGSKTAKVRYYTESPDFTGLCGEYLIGFLIDQDVDERIIAGGHGGKDFDGPDGLVWQVKTAAYWKKPILKLGQREHATADEFMLCAVHQHSRRVRYAGYAFRTELLAAPMEDYGNGPRHSIPEDKLRKGLPGLVTTYGAWLWRCARCLAGTAFYAKGTDLCPSCAGWVP